MHQVTWIKLFRMLKNVFYTGLYFSEDAWCKALCVLRSEGLRKGPTDQCLSKVIYYLEVVSSNIETVCYFRNNMKIYFPYWMMMQNYGGLVCQSFQELCCHELGKVAMAMTLMR
jgi:hypothetical protein